MIERNERLALPNSEDECKDLNLVTISLDRYEELFLAWNTMEVLKAAKSNVDYDSAFCRLFDALTGIFK